MTAPDHLVIPDTQCKPGAPLDHLRWLGEYIVDRRPEVIVHLGDHWDLPSLSMYDAPGSLKMEGQRYEDDIAAGNEGMRLLLAPLRELQAKLKRNKERQYNPRMVLLRGNHEERVMRAINAQPKYAGMIGYHHMDTRGWEVYDLNCPVVIDGVAYSHYFPNPNSGKPWGGTAHNVLGKLAHSFTQGHRQGMDSAERYNQITGSLMRGLIVGSFYLHDEDYKGAQGNHHYRGLVVKHRVRNGGYTKMEVDMDFLCDKYEGMEVGEFLRSKYKNAEHRFSLARESMRQAA